MKPATQDEHLPYLEHVKQLERQDSHFLVVVSAKNPGPQELTQEVPRRKYGEVQPVTEVYFWQDLVSSLMMYPRGQPFS